MLNDELSEEITNIINNIIEKYKNEMDMNNFENFYKELFIESGKFFVDKIDKMCKKDNIILTGEKPYIIKDNNIYWKMN